MRSLAESIRVVQLHRESFVSLDPIYKENILALQRDRCFTYSKHRLTKSINNVSLQRRACAKLLLPGFRLRPLELVMLRGLPLESEQKRKES